MKRAAAIVVALACGCAASPPSPPPPPAVAKAPPRPSPLRLLGETPSLPATSGAPGSVVEAIYHVCLDENLRVAAIMPKPGLAAADEAAMAALRKWSWFGAGKNQCFEQRMLLPVPTQGHLLRQASASVVGKATAGPAPRLPKWLPALYAGNVVEAAYKVCVDDNAAVQSVRPLQSLPGADEALIAALQASSWEVVVGPLAHAPYCFASHARFDFKAPPNVDVLPPVSPYPAVAALVKEAGVSVSPGLSNVQPKDPPLSDVLRRELTRRGIRELVVIYNLCVGPDGRIGELRPIKPVPVNDPMLLESLRAWHFDVTGATAGACSPVRIRFNLDR
jgi:hypothetical protein